MPGELDRQREEIAEAGRAALADIWQTADDAAAAVVRVVAQRTGISIGPPTGPAIMDAHFTDLARMELQAQNYVEAMKRIRQWVLPRDTRTLGEIMPQLPEDVRELIADHLVRAGLS